MVITSKDDLKSKQIKNDKQYIGIYLLGFEQ